MVEVYADLLFLINAGMDGLCFCMTGRLLHRRISPWRVTIGAVLGGLYAVASLFFEGGQAPALLLDVIVCLILCVLVFFHPKTDGLRRLPVTAAVYLLLSMALGGIMTALFHFFNRVGLMNALPKGDDGIGAWLFALLAILGSIITMSGGRFFSRARKICPCRVTVELDGRSMEIDGLVDTGNLLRDPLSGRLVICIDRRVLGGILSPELARVMDDSRAASILSPSEARRLRLIPARGATGHAVLTGFVPDRIYVTDTHTGKEHTRAVDAVIASAELASTQAIIPAELMD